MYIDESGFNLNMIKEYGYQLKSKRLLANRSGKRGDRVTVIAARNHKHQLIAPCYFIGYTDRMVFEHYLKYILLPEIPTNTTLVLDNASFHKGVDIERLVSAKQCTLKYLPPYSPDLNPIEKKCSQLKSWFRKLTHLHDDKVDLIATLLREYCMQA